MANYDNQVNRMQYLMGYSNSLNENKRGNSLEYHTTASDGKEYGIIKEGTQYYIKTTTPDKKTITESYEYIVGYDHRGQNRYNSFNLAAKQLGLKLISINESTGKHTNVSVFDMDRNEKALKTLTEEARKELDRMHQIFENSFISKDNIGNHGNPEGKGTATTGANTTKNNDPFTEKTEAKLDKDMKENGTVKGATPDNDEVKNADSKLQNADKMEKGKRGDEGYKDAHDDLEGEGVADQHKTGAKAVKMNESIDGVYSEGDENADMGFIGGDEQDELDSLMSNPDPEEEMEPINDPINRDESLVGMDGSDDVDITDFVNDETPIDDEEENDLDALLREFMEEEPSAETSAEAPLTEDETQHAKQGNEETLKSYQGKGSGDNNVHGEETMDKMDESEDKIVGPDKVLDGPHGNEKPLEGKPTMAKMDEAINRITDMIYESLSADKKCPKCGKKKCECKDGKCECKKSNKKETIEEAVSRIVAEEVTKLDMWGKHPRYGKEPMSVPANKEVLAGTAEKDWNDDSTKGNERYGRKIGSGAPFDKVVDMLTDNVLANLKESFSRKK